LLGADARSKRGLMLTLTSKRCAAAIAGSICLAKFTSPLGSPDRSIDSIFLCNKSEPGQETGKSERVTAAYRFVREPIETEKDWGIGQHEMLFPAAQPPIA
jgi:hypothetical protein